MSKSNFNESMAFDFLWIVLIMAGVVIAASVVTEPTNPIRKTEKVTVIDGFGKEFQSIDMDEFGRFFKNGREVIFAGEVEIFQESPK